MSLAHCPLLAVYSDMGSVPGTKWRADRGGGGSASLAQGGYRGGRAPLMPADRLTPPILSAERKDCPLRAEIDLRIAVGAGVFV